MRGVLEAIDLKVILTMAARVISTTSVTSTQCLKSVRAACVSYAVRIPLAGLRLGVFLVILVVRLT
jgi:hypothetical protein